MLEMRVTLEHVAICIVSNGEKVRRHLVPSFALVLVNDVLTVDWQTSVGVDSDAEETRVRL